MPLTADEWLQYINAGQPAQPQWPPPPPPEDPAERAALRMRRSVRGLPGEGRAGNDENASSRIAQGLADALIPQSPADFALMAVTGGGGRIAARSALGALALALDPTPANAGPVSAARKAAIKLIADRAEQRAAGKAVESPVSEVLTPNMAPDWKPPGIGHNMPPEPIDQALGDVVAPRPQGPSWMQGLPRPKPAAQSTDIPNIRGLPVDEAIAIARDQPHLIKSGERGEGLYVGGPRNLQTKQALNKVRQQFDEFVARDTRGADWYDRYRAGTNEVTGGNPVHNQWMSAQEGQWSAGVDPGSELHFALKENNSAIAGMPVKAARPAQHEAHLAAIEAKDPSLYQLGEKTGEYAAKVNPDQPLPPGATGVNDFRHFRNFGYTEKSGAPQKNAVGAAGHRFMDMETALAVDRANRSALGGRTDWTGERLQAAPWVVQKAGDIQDRNKNLSYEDAFQRANRTITDYFPRHTAFATHEAQPGATDHMVSSVFAPQEERVAYAADPRSTWANAPGGRDAIYSGTGIPGTGVYMRVRPTEKTQGYFTNPSGIVEGNPGEVARPLVTFDTGGKEGPFKATTAHDQAILNAGEAVRAYVDAQAAGAWHKPWAGGPANQSTSLVFPRPGPSTPGELDKISSAFQPYGVNFISDTGSGVTVARPLGENKAFDKAVRGGAFEQFGTPRRVRIGEPDAGYIDYSKQWDKGVGSGAATREMLSYVNKTPELRAALNSNPHIAENALARLERDNEWAAKWGAPREDIQNARRIIGDGGPGWIDRIEAALKGGAILPATAAAIFAGAQAGQPDGGSNEQF